MPPTLAWSRTIAPALAATLLLTFLVAMVVNFDSLLGVAPSSPIRWLLAVTVLAAALGGAVWALYLRGFRPDVYADIGGAVRAPKFDKPPSTGTTPTRLRLLPSLRVLPFLRRRARRYFLASIQIAKEKTVREEKGMHDVHVLDDSVDRRAAFEVFLAALCKAPVTDYEWLTHGHQRRNVGSV